jgi:hypothetical protein
VISLTNCINESLFPGRTGNAPQYVGTKNNFGLNVFEEIEFVVWSALLDHQSIMQNKGTCAPKKIMAFEDILEREPRSPEPFLPPWLAV